MWAMTRRPVMRLLMALRFLPTIYYGMSIVLIPLMINHLAGNKTTVALYSTVGLIVASIAQLLTGRAADRFGHRRPTLVGYAALIVAALGLAAFADQLWGVFLFGVMGLAVAWSLAALMFVLVSDGVPSAEHGRAFGLLHATWSLAMIGGALLGGALTRVGAGLPFLVAGLLNIASVVVAWPSSRTWTGWGLLGRASVPGSWMPPLEPHHAPGRALCPACRVLAHPHMPSNASSLTSNTVPVDASGSSREECGQPVVRWGETGGLVVGALDVDHAAAELIQPAGGQLDAIGAVEHLQDHIRPRPGGAQVEDAQPQRIVGGTLHLDRARERHRARGIEVVHRREDGQPGGVVGALGRGGVGDAGALDHAWIVRAHRLALDRRHPPHAQRLPDRHDPLADQHAQPSPVSDLGHDLGRARAVAEARQCVEVEARWHTPRLRLPPSSRPAPRRSRWCRVPGRCTAG